MSTLPQAEFDALLDHIYEHGTHSEGITERARKLCEAYAQAACTQPTPVIVAPDADADADTMNKRHGECYGIDWAYPAATKLTDAQTELILDAADEWSAYVEVDSAPRTLRAHMQIVLDSLKGTP